MFTVKVSYTGRPGVHNDGDGTTEGWFRASDGGFVTTEPVASEDWMPLNDHPTAKPTYDFYDTVSAGKTAVANGVLKSVTRHAPDAEFPGGSATWHWHSRAPVASYLVENSVGNYTLTSRVGSDGIRYYQAQDTSISAAQQKKNLAIMNQQQDITDFESQFNGPFPFTSDGIIIGTPEASFEEEMQTMITFAGGQIDLDTLYHENMHQWWGDNVSESGYTMTFFKEGMATLGEYLFAARTAEKKAGGPGTAGGPEGVPGQPDQAVQQDLRHGPAASGPPRRPTRPRTACSTTPPPTSGPAPPTSRCGGSSAPPGSPRPCGRSSAATAAATSPSRSWRPASATGCPARARPAAPGSASSSPSGSTPPTRAAAAPTGPPSPGRGWRVRASTTAVAARSACPQEARRRTMLPLSRAMASRSAAASWRSPNVSDSTGPLNQWPRGQRILALSSGPSVDLIR